jgi:hypothetical protein
MSFVAAFSGILMEHKKRHFFGSSLPFYLDVDVMEL